MNLVEIRNELVQVAAHGSKTTTLGTFTAEPAYRMDSHALGA
ncbi:hypothetical protein [Streptomyces sp. ISL-11]|nr:hypothetical protein [Streptomyces sp. ISL-11]